MRINDPIASLPGVGPKLQKSLEKIKIKQIRDLLFYFPMRYADFSQLAKIKELRPGQTVTIKATVKSIAARFSFRARLSLCEAVVSDDTGSIKVVWFNQAYLAKSLHAGDEIFLSGTAEAYKGLQLTNPVYEKVNPEMIHTGRLVPIYRLTEGLYHRTIRNLIHDALPAAKDLIDIIPADIRKSEAIPHLVDAINAIHFPQKTDDARKAQDRFAFEELFIQQLIMLRRKQLLAALPAPNIPADIAYIKKFLASLPFTFTDSQRRALWQIMQNMDAGKHMNRLLQGDVGSGKTVVALASMLLTHKAGFHSVLLAPTEILARQHYESLSKIIKNFDKKISVVLWTKTFLIKKEIDLKKAELINSLKKSKRTLIVATHTILQQKQALNNLGLVIVDEQHRFGVEQRSFLLHKRDEKTLTPHLLSMSATPIPRTLAMSVFADLEVSTLLEKPKGREKIITSVIPEHKRLKAYDFIKNELKTGRQAFIVTPRVENGDEDVKSAKAEYEHLSKTIFKDYKVGLVYGRLKGQSKGEVMAKFNAGELDVLVATSVVEIGIDVPNATVMLIEGAENFGLAQLHQLRGRVGRGNHKSHCLLFTNVDNPESLQRLELFSKTDNGFQLAEIDLKLRGFGDLLGTTQSGYAFKFVKFFTQKTLDQAKSAAKNLLLNDPKLSNNPILQNTSNPNQFNIHLDS